MNTRMLLLLTLATAAPTAIAFADDGSNASPGTAAVTPPTASEFTPMTSSERLRQYMLSLTSTESVFRAASSAGIRQAENSPKEWGGGAEGYGFRVGDAFAQHVIRGTLQYGVSAMLHEDNRYFHSGETGFFRRAKYAVKSTFMARHDNGQQYLSASRLSGAVGTSFISRVWQPRSTNSAGDGAVRLGVSLGTDAGYNVLREFWPDLKRHFRKD